MSTASRTLNIAPVAESVGIHLTNAQLVRMLLVDRSFNDTYKQWAWAGANLGHFRRLSKLPTHEIVEFLCKVRRINVDLTTSTACAQILQWIWPQSYVYAPGWVGNLQSVAVHLHTYPPLSVVHALLGNSLGSVVIELDSPEVLEDQGGAADRQLRVANVLDRIRTNVRKLVRLVLVFPAQVWDAQCLDLLNIILRQCSPRLQTLQLYDIPDAELLLSPDRVWDDLSSLQLHIVDAPLIPLRPVQLQTPLYSSLYHLELTTNAGIAVNILARTSSKLCVLDLNLVATARGGIDSNTINGRLERDHIETIFDSVQVGFHGLTQLRLHLPYLRQPLSADRLLQLVSCSRLTVLSIHVEQDGQPDLEDAHLQTLAHAFPYLEQFDVRWKEFKASYRPDRHLCTNVTVRGLAAFRSHTNLCNIHLYGIQQDTKDLSALLNLPPPNLDASGRVELSIHAFRPCPLRCWEPETLTESEQSFVAKFVQATKHAWGTRRLGLHFSVQDLFWKEFIKRYAEADD
ncbi:hypothetical protein CALVIDRAFT_568966 [Calocera viscosa TUFC12733]|uniref:Uncharacterized protein n=1 Tax=Calocera viscosa (strain TUFC12733) TaxID=1330018 RepID=A0A167GGW0_CALVF|nr:hypothetical protein CALVIDRAFT_568966 [Calocera viscosa TUFC12733]